MKRAFFVLTLAAACDPVVDVPTYHGEVKDILDRNCVACHQQGGIGPMALDTYAAAAELHEMIAPAVASRLMPPTTIDASGDCGEFVDVKYLTDDEIATVVAWSEAGAPEGVAGAQSGDAPGPQALEDVGAVLDMGDVYEPSEAALDDYRCFLVDPALTEDRFLTGYEVRPGDPGVVHHVILYYPVDEAAEAQAQALDDSEDGLGFSCFGDGRVDAQPIVAWAPGSGATRFPEGTGIRMHAGRRVVMQVHYNVSAGSAPDRTKIDLALADEVAEEAQVGILFDDEMVLPAGEDETTWTYGGTSPASGRIRGLFPHMHTLGRTMKVTITDSLGEERCIMAVDRWDFHWQRFFFYDGFEGLEIGDRVDVTCTYDTTSRDSDVLFGEGTADEMCVVISYFTLD